MSVSRYTAAPTWTSAGSALSGQARALPWLVPEQARPLGLLRALAGETANPVFSWVLHPDQPVGRVSFFLSKFSRKSKEGESFSGAAGRTGRSFFPAGGAASF